MLSMMNSGAKRKLLDKIFVIGNDPQVKMAQLPRQFNGTDISVQFEASNTNQTIESSFLV